MAPDADWALFKSQLQFVLWSDCKLQASEPGLRWWRLGPLTDVELWEVKVLIARTGLRVARADLRVAPMGPFRSAVYFAASGMPNYASSDNGSWCNSEASFTPAAASQPSVSLRAPQPANPMVPTIQPWAPCGGCRCLPPVGSLTICPTQPPASSKQHRQCGQRGSGQPASAGGAAGGASEASATSVEAQLAALVSQVGALSQEITDLRKESFELRKGRP